MRTRRLLALTVAVALFACGKDEPAPTTGGAAKPDESSTAIAMPPSTAAAAEEHSHDPQHGGHVVELGEHEGHLEIVHDDATGTLTAYVYDADMKPVATEAPVINLTKGAVQIPMTPLSGAGPKSDAWKATHDALKQEPEGRLRVKIGDKTYQATLEHPHE
jgi:hypothetical protein